jgi:hypothetical protein
LKAVQLEDFTQLETPRAACSSETISAALSSEAQQYSAASPEEKWLIVHKNSQTSKDQK